MKEFQKVINKLISLFKEIIPIENDKLRAARENQVSVIEDCMIREQALILKLKGVEKEREEAQKKAGFSGLSFREILEKVPTEQRELLLPLFDELSREIQMFREVNADAGRIIETNLHQIQKAVEAKEGNIYRQDGSAQNSEKYFTDKKI